MKTDKSGCRKSRNGDGGERVPIDNMHKIFFFGHTHSIQEFLSEIKHMPEQTPTQSHSSDNARFFTCYAMRELLCKFILMKTIHPHLMHQRMVI